ncbi:hypothetical protein DPMN_033172 [Dreissena polymorpha]|uniref:Uncharacterized protein n=1 Tax=Dreissena polymorpha TaxID=45954 RepID=A0A9D4M652_DREPO|nr:hypothetical protein DPMN_033172 [Dreissena polymorpha]
MLSSANQRVVDASLSGMSSVYSRKRRGPRTGPWGTPDVTGQSMRCYLQQELHGFCCSGNS